MDLVFVRSLISDPVLVKPRMLGSNYLEVVERLLRDSHEGVCSRHGFIMPDSISVHKILSSRVEAVSLNGDVRYDVAYFASVCNPAIGSVIEGRVINMNRFGVLVHSGVQSPDGTFLPVVETIVTRQPIGGVESEVDLDALEIGQTVRIQIAGKKFELNDDKISVIARIVAPNTPSAQTAPNAQTSPSAQTATIQTSLGRFAASHAMLEDPGSDDPEEGSGDDEAGFDDAAGVDDEGGESDEDDDDLDKKNLKKLKKNKKLAILASAAAAGAYDDEDEVDGEDEEDDDDDDEDEEDDDEDDDDEEEDEVDDEDGDEAADEEEADDDEKDSVV